MIQKIYEFCLDHSTNNMKLFNFLCDTFPKMNKTYMDRLDREVAAVYIPQEISDRMTHNVWQRLCDNIPELDRSKF